MALTINTNLYSLTAQRNLNQSQGPLATAMQRLSSGLRINSAKDDAAGLAIATRMDRQVQGLGVAVQNANNGISFAQTAEGAMGQMVNSLQRINDLAIQSASNNTSLDRSSMNQEVTQLVAELNRTVSQTRYNGDTFLNKQTSISIQVGTEVGDTMNIASTNVSPTAYGVQTSRVDFTNDAAGVNNNQIASAVAAMGWRSNGMSAAATLGGVNLGNALVASDVTNNSINVISRINTYAAQTNVTAFSFGNALVGTAAIGTADLATNGAAYANVNAGYLTINGIAIGSTTAAATTAAAFVTSMVAAINAQSANTGVTAVALGTADTGATTNSIALVNTSGAAINVQVATANAGIAGAAAAYFGTQGGTVAAGQNGQIIYSAPLGNSSVAIAAGQDADAFGVSSLNTSISMNGARSINSINVSTVGEANLAILAVKQGLETINSAKSTLGAMLNRLDSTVSNLQNVSENITAAKSRIMDADFAAETANMTKAMITQQAGISVLAQANQIPQQVLALLK